MKGGDSNQLIYNKNILKNHYIIYLHIIIVFFKKNQKLSLIKIFKISYHYYLSEYFIKAEHRRVWHNISPILYNIIISN